jgi:photosystem II stability/assembly factor-like uncharacterized protein
MYSRWIARAAALAILMLSALPGHAAATEIKVDSETFAGLDARPIGPAAMSGRIAALDAVQGEWLTIYVGAAGGGVWKSSDGGTTFKPVFDKHCQSIGAIAIDRTDARTVWVGTGESWTRNSTSVGDGIYRTTDGGENWERMGLPGSERIARIAIDPQRGDTVFVAATGHLWDAHPERGVFRTRDGGKTWSRVLYVDENTGCADLALDPSDPRIVYAAMWQFRRTGWSFASGGPGSGLYKSTDGGDTWNKLTRGLPARPLGRIGITVSPARPERLYAVVEASQGGLYRSDDRGETWTGMNSGANITIRPFYFGCVVAAPNHADHVYKPGLRLSASEDGGKTFTQIGGSTHGDHHALWINPSRPEQFVLGTDGGVYLSNDRGNHWRFLANLPVSQFYHVSHDLEWPYNVYGGLQDNGTWVGPSQKSGGIGNRHWRVLGGGDGFWAFVDPKEPDITYIEYQGGKISRVRRSTGETKEIAPLRGAGEPEYRFNWNTPIHVGDSGDLYFGAQFLFRSRDHGDTWERISQDLTTNDPAKQRQEESGGVSVDNSSAENHCTIFTISESPRNRDLVWVGTDDGNLQLTRDGGRTWTNVARNLKGVPPGTWISRVAASRHQEGVAYVTLDGHTSGDMKPYVFKTSDYGKTWASLVTPETEGYAHVIQEDRVNPQLLFLGTELGLWISLDGGRQWGTLRPGLPRVAVRDLAIHPRESALIVATHGRGIHILDDLTPLRGLTAEVLQADAAFLPSKPSVMVIPTGEQRFDGDAEFEGRSVDEAAQITYYLRKRHMFGDLKLEVYDSQGALLSTIPGGKRRGINRVSWPMRLKPPKVPPAANLVPQFFSMVGPRVPEGSYTVKLIRGQETYASTVQLVPDPRSTHSAEDRALQQKAALRLYGTLETLTWLADAVGDARDQAEARAGRLPRGESTRRRLGDLAGQLEELRKTLSATREGRLTGEERLREKIAGLYGAVNGYEGRPTAAQLQYTEVLEGELSAAQTRFAAITGKTLPALNTGLVRLKLEPIETLSREEWIKRQQKG